MARRDGVVTGRPTFKGQWLVLLCILRSFDYLFGASLTVHFQNDRCQRLVRALRLLRIYPLSAAGRLDSTRSCWDDRDSAANSALGEHLLPLRSPERRGWLRCLRTVGL